MNGFCWPGWHIRSGLSVLVLLAAFWACVSLFSYLAIH